MKKNAFTICVLFFAVISVAPSGGPCFAEPNESADSLHNSTGPTVSLNYYGKTPDKNPVYDFMYFVPLISPTLVEIRTSRDNHQEAGIISGKKNSGTKSFRASYEFVMEGDGFYINIFDHEDMIEKNLEKIKSENLLLLDYIKFDGCGYGRVDVRGEIVDSVETVTEVRINFAARDQKSPVTICVYNVKCVNGQYKFANRYNMTVARVDTLIFERDGDHPKMGIKLASLGGSKGTNGLWSTVKGRVANFFIEPPEITCIGNKAMLDFGDALLKADRNFTFPKAPNLKPTPSTAGTANVSVRQARKTRQ